MSDELDRFVTLTEAAPILRMSRSAAFRLAQHGEFPVPVHNVGGKRVVSLRRLVEFVNSEAAA